MNDELVTLTQSRLRTIAECLCRDYWRYERGLVPAETPGYFSRGRVFHKALALYLKGASRAKALKGATPTGEPTDDVLLGLFLAERWIEHYGRKTWRTVRSSVEHVFEVEVPGNVIWTGRIDVAEAYAGDHRWIVEHKTSFKIDRDFLAHLPLDYQVTGYVLGATLDPGLRNPYGCIYNMIKTPSKYRRVGEDTAEYLYRMAGEYRANSVLYFRQQRLVRGEVDWGPFLDVVRWAADRVRECRENKHFPRVGTASRCCFPVMGRPCVYAELCMRGETAAALAQYKYEEPFVELLESEE